MRNGYKRHSFLLAGLSAALLATTWPAQAGFSFFSFSGHEEAGSPAPEAKLTAKKIKKARKFKDTSGEKTSKSDVAIPQGPLHIIVSIADQRATLYANGLPVAHTAVSTGTPGHPTPMGVFSVIQKDRHHVSNLYDAPMPYMQRITWSGAALHTGALPGRPASHGCIRLTNDFAALLWKATKIGARVIVTRNDVIPVEIDSPNLFAPKPKIAAKALVQTADASNATAIPTQHDSAERAEITGSTTPQAAVPAVIAAPKISSGPVSVFISRKAGKIYVRQAQQPLFDMPVTIRNPDQPLGTHVYTAMEVKDGGTSVRWTSVSIPSSYARISEPKKREARKHQAETVGHAAVTQEPSPTASAALDRIEMPKEAIDRIADLISPGSSLIVSDNGISDETGKSTDFIILTR